MIPLYPHLDTYPKELKSVYYSDMVTSMFIAAHFTIVKSWNQTRSLSKDEWIKKMWSIYTMEFYSAIKKD